MIAPRWTPGPWNVDPEYLDDVRDTTGVNLVAQAYVIPKNRGGGFVRRANARLIAKAPEMYDALSTVTLAMNFMLVVQHDESWREMYDMASALLAEIRGEA